ncbi:MAG: hypothetical protein LBE76_06830 [Nitrososphaerota archaeon]|nr:hypothetical protein [Nitrososphaerota archaeon]
MSDEEKLAEERRFQLKLVEKNVKQTLIVAVMSLVIGLSVLCTTLSISIALASDDTNTINTAISSNLWLIILDFVIIGIFSAICWNEWHKDSDKIEKEFITKYLTPKKEKCSQNITNNNIVIHVYNNHTVKNNSDVESVPDT